METKLGKRALSFLLAFILQGSSYAALATAVTIPDVGDIEISENIVNDSPFPSIKESLENDNTR